MDAARPVPLDWLTGEVRTIAAPTVLDLFDRQVAAAPHASAAAGGRSLTYGELDAASAALATTLAGRGVAAGSRVGVLVERSTDLLVGMLGAWRAGCAYLPLDLDHPDERVALLAAGTAAVVTRASFASRVPAGIAVVPLDETGTGAGAEPVADRHPDPLDVAYVIYTSGSTGAPKPVEIAHRSLVNVVGALIHALRVGPDEHWMTMAPPTFDISLAELCVPLAAGARVTITSGAQARDAGRLVRLIRDAGVTRMQAVPSQWQALLDAGLDAPALLGMTGGEALPPGLAADLVPRLAGLVNGYGPTETTVLSTLWPVPAAPAPGSIRLGRPIANTRLYVLDDARAEVALGAPGELYIAGAGVARGYASDDVRTAAAFPPDPWVPGERMYRTGDRVRWADDGGLEYLGRTDGQVKIRGQRVELGEVEAGLVRLASVRSAVTVAREGDLVAYVVPADAAAPPTPQEVREHAAATLPSVMTPTSVVVLPAYPLTPNGKIDRSALARLSPAAAGPTGPEAAMTTDDPFTAEFCALVGEVLGAERVGPDDDFFDVGGHSLAVMRVVAAIADRWRIEVSSDVFYDTDTVADLASAVKALRVSA